jgi:tol-pal system protein YbgF
MISTMAVLATAILTSGCAAGLVQKIDDQQAALDAMQARLDAVSQESEARSQEVDAIGRDVQQMGIKVTQTEEQVSGINNRTENLNTRVALLTEDVTRLKASATQPAQPAPGALRFSETLGGETVGGATGNMQAMYDSALRLYHAKEAQRSLEAFSAFLQSHPQTDLSDNAEYWSGECYYMLEEFPEALEAFRRVFNHSFDDKYDDSQLKIGMTLRHLGRRDEAIAAFQELLTKYPDSQYIELARRYLAELGGGGR